MENHARGTCGRGTGGLRDAHPLRWSNILWAVMAMNAGICGQARADEATPIVRWERGPRVVTVADEAHLAIPEGYRWAGPDDARRLGQQWQIPDFQPSGVVSPAAEDSRYFVSFRFVGDGYVVDDEKDRLDPSRLLKAIREATDRANVESVARGWATIDEVEWLRPPFYDGAGHNLGWAMKFKVGGRPAANYDIRLLGRAGLVEVKLAANLDDISALIPARDTLLDGFSFDPYKRYADHKAGDRTATYGLVALVAGGSGLFTAQSGMLGGPSLGASRHSASSPSPGARFSGASASNLAGTYRPDRSIYNPGPRAPFPGLGDAARSGMDRSGMGTSPTIFRPLTHESSIPPSFGADRRPAYSREMQGLPKIGESSGRPGQTPAATSGPHVVPKTPGAVLIEATKPGGSRKGIFAAIGAAILAACAWAKKQLGGGSDAAPTAA